MVIDSPHPGGCHEERVIQLQSIHESADDWHGVVSGGDVADN